MTKTTRFNNTGSKLRLDQIERKNPDLGILLFCFVSMFR
jgi:hypothetical protein